jgi:hypothetical protein
VIPILILSTSIFIILVAVIVLSMRRVANRRIRNLKVIEMTWQEAKRKL